MLVIIGEEVLCPKKFWQNFSLGTATQRILVDQKEGMRAANTIWSLAARIIPIVRNFI